jgi:hypothetical protein
MDDGSHNYIPDIPNNLFISPLIIYLNLLKNLKKIKIKYISIHLYIHIFHCLFPIYQYVLSKPYPNQGLLCNLNKT